MTPEQRRERRRAEMEQADLDFWASMTAEDRIRAMWSIVEDSLALQGDVGPTPRLEKSVGGVRPRKS